MRRWVEGPVRLSLRPAGGQGQPYGDEVVAAARELVESTTLSQKQIGARVGVSHMSVCRWARAGGWRRPAGTALAPDAYPWRWRSERRFAARTKPWRLLAEAEAIVAGEPSPDRMVEALAWLLAARALHARRVGHRRARRGPLPSPSRGAAGRPRLEGLPVRSGQCVLRDGACCASSA